MSFRTSEYEIFIEYRYYIDLLILWQLCYFSASHNFSAVLTIMFVSILLIFSPSFFLQLEFICVLGILAT